MNENGQSFLLKVLVAASVVKDMEMTVSILATAGFRAESCRDIFEICSKMNDDTGALLISEEMLFSEDSNILSEKLEKQPPWSDIPIIILTSPASNIASNSLKLEKILLRMRNATLVEKPVRIASLITSVRSALNGRRRQYEVRNLLLDLEKAKQSAESANRSKSTFLANMSHEIRTPLGAIIGFSGLLAEPDVTEEERRQFIDTIQRNGQALTHLIDDILDLSKVEAGLISVESVPVDLKHLLEDVIQLMRKLAQNKKIDLHLNMPPHLPVIISDPTRLRQILINVIGNALKFTEKGSVSISVVIRDDKIYFEIEDTGCGISDKQASKLFQPFSQADESTTRLYGGTGLGLALSRKLARALGGDLILKKSKPGVGSVFEAAIAYQPQSTHSQTRLAIGENYNIQGVKVLLAEDVPDNQALIARVLKAQGADIEIANNGREAIEKALSNRYDIVLMDIQMPVLDGYSATRELRSRHYQVPILALTAHAMKEDRDLTLQAGCNGHLTKPINPKELYQSIFQFTKGSRKVSVLSP